MKIKFNGLYETKKKGCSACGRRASSGTTFVTSKMYILPSGRHRTFYVGRVDEVSEADGRFLLSYNTAKGTPIFEKVE